MTTNKKIKKLTWKQLVRLFTAYNDVKSRTNNVALCKDSKLHAVVVFKASNWPDDDCPLDRRSYHCTSNNTCFHSDRYGKKCYASAIDGSDSHVDISKQGWEIDYCYLI